MPALICALTFGLTLSALAATPTSGLYRAGRLGFLELRTQTGHTRAIYRGGGDCAFAPEVQVLEGQWESNVFVGTVLLCQQGPSCAPEKNFPFLAVWHEPWLAGEVKVDTGCASPALQGSRLVLEPASPDDRALATKTSGNKKQLQDEAKRSLLLGLQKLQEGDFRSAAYAFERGISYDDGNWAAWQGLGVAELQLKNVSKSLASFQRALSLSTLAKVGGAQVADLHFNVACAQSQAGNKKEALQSLRLALKLGGPRAYLEPLDREPDLDPLRADPEFRRVVAEARAAKEKGPKKR